jgi:hypothetical protein
MTDKHESSNHSKRRFPTNPGDSEPTAGEGAYDRLISRLVTGDLDDERRRALVEWLEEKPERWRQCGLAFLEAQAWHEGMLELIEKAEPTVELFPGDAWRNPPPRPDGESRPGEMPHALRPPNRSRRASFTFRLVAATAASALLAYSLGVLTGSRWREEIRSISATEPVHPAPAPSSDSRNQAEPEADPRPEAPGVVSAPRLADLRETPAQTFAVMKFHSPKSGTREVQVPVVAGSAIDEQWLSSEPVSVPDEVQDELEKRGFQVQQRRQFFDVRLEDGRHAIIPVDQYQVSFVKHLSL